MLATTFLHAFYVIVESAVLMFISHKSLQEGLIGQSLSDATVNMHKDSKIDLRVRASIIDSPVTDSFNNSIEQIGKTIVTINQSTKDISKESQCSI
jgi:methyl-accepting chemotaxis protein